MHAQKILLLLCTSLLTSPAFAESIDLVASGDFVWETTPEGVAFAPLQGDRFQEPYQAMVRLPGGTISPPHVKSANMSGVMLEGEMIHYPQGTNPETAKAVGPGAFYFIPAGMAHVSACISAVPCVVYLYQDNAFDFKLVTE